MKKRKKLKKESWINKQTNREEGEKAEKATDKKYDVPPSVVISDKSFD
jgi:hypothetical protein